MNLLYRTSSDDLCYTTNLPIEILQICGNITCSLSSNGYPHRLTTGVNMIVVTILSDKHQQIDLEEFSIHLMRVPWIKNVPTSYTKKQTKSKLKIFKAKYINQKKKKKWRHGKTLASASEGN